jgi:hypothetical protein
MRLHKVTMTHYAPKDRQSATAAYVLADSEEQVMDYIDRTFQYGRWKDGTDDDKGSECIDPTAAWWKANPDAKDRAASLGLTIDNFKSVTGPYRALVLWWRGDFDEDFADAYYGITQHAWDAGAEVSEEDAAVLVRLGVAVDIRGGV